MERLPPTLLAQILPKLSDRTLEKLCLSSSYIFKLCQDPYFLDSVNRIKLFIRRNEKDYQKIIDAVEEIADSNNGKLQIKFIDLIFYTIENMYNKSQINPNDITTAEIALFCAVTCPNYNISCGSYMAPG